MFNQPHERSVGDTTLAFGAWTLNPRTGALVRQGGPAVTLRPKTASVLAELLATPGLLVSRDTLFERVWPGVTVTDDSVTQCIAEIRRALGEDGRLLRTAPRRGYVLDTPLPSGAEPAGSPMPVTVEPPSGPRPHRTGRRWRLIAGLGSAIVVSCGAAVLALALHQPRSGRAEAQRLMREGRTVFYSAGDHRQIWPEARALFLRAHEAEPGNPDPDAWAAFTYTNMIIAGYSTDRAGDLAEAARLADRAVAHGPALGATWAARAGVYRLDGRFPEALEAYRRAVALDPAQLPAKANSGWMLVLLGQPGEALEPIRSVLAATREDHAFHTTWLCYLGLAQFAAADGDRGVQALRGTLASRDSCLPLAERTFYLAAGLALDGNLEAATAMVSDARREWPDITVQTLRAAAISANPGFLAQREALFEALAQAGFSASAP